MKNFKTEYLLHLADNALILSHRLGEWCGHAPILEQDIALTNITLDILGQARYFYQYAAKSDNKGKSEDYYAFFRNERDFKNLLILEQPNGDWAQTMLRQFLYDNYCLLLYQSLTECSDNQIAAIASKAVKEVKYHYKFSSEWVMRLGDGTEESKKRLENALENLWIYTGEMFEITPYETEMIKLGIAPDPSKLKHKWLENTQNIFKLSNLSIPKTEWFQKGGKTGYHTENLGKILTDLQYMQRSYPNCNW
ncbi:MAG: phenylacetate-CoA oxygenase subunit PaaC [Bacteroidetes bacterium]|nr:phenylacetate-CoA oxygenase subunit PaaC [Bacteroidota bacterium]